MQPPKHMLVLIERYTVGMQPGMSALEYTVFPISFPRSVAHQPSSPSDPSMFPPCLISAVFTGMSDEDE